MAVLFDITDSGFTFRRNRFARGGILLDRFRVEVVVNVVTSSEGGRGYASR